MTKNSMSLSSRAVALSLLVVVFLGGVLIWSQNDTKSDTTEALSSVAISNGSKSADTHSSDSSVFEKKVSKTRQALETAVMKLMPDDVIVIYDAIAQVQVDDDDNIIVDQELKKLLESSFNGLELNLSEDDLEEVQDYIRLGLPGKAGEQAATLFLDYYHYRLAEAGVLLDVGSGEVESIRSNFETLVSMRYASFGHDVAEKLYANEHAEIRELLRVMEEEKEVSVPIENRADDYGHINIENVKKDHEWEVRYRKFNDKKQHILNAMLSSSEEDAQIQALIREYYEEDEIEALHNYEIEISSQSKRLSANP